MADACAHGVLQSGSHSLPHLVKLPSLASFVASEHCLLAQPPRVSCVHHLHDNARPARDAHKLQVGSCSIWLRVCSNVKLTSKISPRMPRPPSTSQDRTALLQIQPDIPTLKERGDLPYRRPVDLSRRKKGSMRPGAGMLPGSCPLVDNCLSRHFLSFAPVNPHQEASEQSGICWRQTWCEAADVLRIAKQ